MWGCRTRLIHPRSVCPIHPVSGLHPPSVHAPLHKYFPPLSQTWPSSPQWPRKRAGKTHISQVQNEAVAVVETVPGHRYLSCTDYTTSFDLEESLYHHLIGYHVLESRCHASFLSGEGDSVSPGEEIW